MYENIMKEIENLKQSLEQLSARIESSAKRQYKINLVSLSDTNVVLYEGSKMIYDHKYESNSDIEWDMYDYGNTVHIDIKTPNVNAFLVRDLIKHLVRRRYYVEFDDGLTLVKDGYKKPRNPSSSTSPTTLV